MTPEDIRAQAIHRVAKAIWGMNHGPEWPWESLIYDDPYRIQCMEGAAVAVDALAEAGLLPTGVDYRWAYEPDGTPLGYRERQLLTEWRDGAIPCSGCGDTERQCGRFRVGVKCCPDCRHRFWEVSE